MCAAWVEAIGTWFAAIATTAAVFVALYLANRNERNEQNNNLIKKWNRIYHNLRDMSIHLEVAADYDQRIKEASDRYQRTATLGQLPSDYDQQLTGKWMQLSSESFKVALNAESKIIDELAGEKSIKISDKEKIFRSINMKESHRRTPAQVAEQAKDIARLNIELVLPNLDPEFRNILTKN